MTSAEKVKWVFDTLTDKDAEVLKSGERCWGSAQNRPRLKSVAEYCIERWPGDIIEIGLGHGRTTMIFAEIARACGRRVIGVDPFDVRTGFGDNRSEQFNIYTKNTRPWQDTIDLIKESSLVPETVATIKARELCFAYVDGLHQYEACLSDILTVGHCNGIIAVDDILVPEGYPAGFTIACRRAFSEGAEKLGRQALSHYLSREGYLV